MYKKILCAGALALGLNGLALADDIGGGEYSAGIGNADFNSGIYFGGQLGTTKLHYSGSSYTSAKSTYDNKYNFAGRIYFGYAFSQFISTELGYDYFGRPKFKLDDGNTQDVLQQGIDLMAKASLPLDYGFGVYAKGGLAWVYRSALHKNNGFASKDANGTFTPIGSFGVNYWFAPNIALDVSWTKTMSVSDLPTIDLFSAGVTYRINI